MTQEDKELLLQDLCARLPYGVKYQDKIEGGIHILSLGIIHHYERFIPYLRPMSSMTEKEKEELKKEHVNDEKIYTEVLKKIAKGDESARGTAVPHFAADWCNANHFDYRGLIEKGLALEAPNEIYNN